MPEAELKRLAAESRREPGANWKRWEPYLAERQWRTVREDYSKDGRPWLHFTHEVSIWPLIAGEKIAVGHYQSSVQALLPTRVVEMVSIRFLRSAYWALRGWRVITAKTSRKPTTVSIQLPRTLI